MTPHSSTLAWKTPWMEEPAVHGFAKSRTWLSDFTFTFHFHALEKEMSTHSSVLAWRIPGTGEPDGLPSMGSHRVGHDWSNLAAAAAADQVLTFGWMAPLHQCSQSRLKVVGRLLLKGLFLCLKPQGDPQSLKGALSGLEEESRLRRPQCWLQVLCFQVQRTRACGERHLCKWGENLWPFLTPGNKVKSLVWRRQISGLKL